ncbi:MAG: MBL fold metallo-hydrolase [Clostridiales bacterium]|jgi:phosphoribosyl 1,2-cyclic phosphodiesterase|nr:MBL fold metallo-hydrolase [Clostridiales bacterium]
MSVKFCPLLSGSSGNCTYVGYNDTHILVDAGSSGKQIEFGLRDIDVDPRDLSAIFVTHEHSDHISGIGIMSRRYNLPIYASPFTWRYLKRHMTAGKIHEDLTRVVEPGIKFHVGDISALPFQIPHDASQPVGYSIFADDHKLTIATDIGHITDCVKDNLARSEVVLLESNHDLDMLINGRYPKILKDRILSDHGHLSNASAGKLLAMVYSPCLRYVYLGHLSEENNRPLIALDTVGSILEAANINTIKLMIADRYASSEPVFLP